MKNNFIIGSLFILVLGAMGFILMKEFDPQWRQTALLPGSPMPIPHPVEGRRKCAACHVGVAALEHLRTPHPERISCMQCHVPRKTTAQFTRPH